MEVLNESAGLLCNAEVLTMLQNLKSDVKGSSKHVLQKLNEKTQQLTEKEKNLQRLNTIIYETVKYLEEMPCATQTTDSVKAFLTQISAFNLTKAEKLQLLNQRPTTLVEIQLLIEESEERLTEDQISEILTIVEQTLPPAPDNDSKVPSEEEDANS